jgi:hypothetical protein
MILNAEQAVEIGEALLDAAEAVKNTEQPQSVKLINNIAVSVPADHLTDDWEHVAYIDNKK